MYSNMTEYGREAEWVETAASLATSLRAYVRQGERPYDVGSTYTLPWPSSVLLYYIRDKQKDLHFVTLSNSV